MNTISSVLNCLQEKWFEQDECIIVVCTLWGGYQVCPCVYWFEPHAATCAMYMYSLQLDPCYASALWYKSKPLVYCRVHNLPTGQQLHPRVHENRRIVTSLAIKMKRRLLIVVSCVRVSGYLRCPCVCVFQL